MPRSEAMTVAEKLQSLAAADAQRVAVRFLGNAEGEVRTIAYGELDRWARRLAATAADRYSPGTRALVMCPPGPEYVAAFYGCLYGGLIPVPVYPPSPMVPGRALGRLRAVAKDVGADLALTVDALRRSAASMEVSVGDHPLQWLYLDSLEDGAEAGWEPRVAEGKDTAFLQYTSGSTADPKGVVITHDNLLANLNMVTDEYGLSEDTIPVSWLPPFHDMGLVAGIIMPLWLGATTVMMAPETFLRRPLRWLTTIADHGADFSPAPNFAYELCIRKAETADLGGLDLRTWRVAINGAEPVRPDTLRRFLEVFGPYGFASDTFWPSYGMAENVVFSAAAPLGTGAKELSLDQAKLQGGQVVLCSDPAAAVQKMTCGAPAAGSTIRVVDQDTRLPCSPSAVGEIWIRGPHVAAGYWQRPEETDRTFGASLADGSPERWLRTGDLGALVDGCLLVTGRVKDLLIVRGANYYPQDLEVVMEAAHPALRADCGVAFTVDDGRVERLVLVQGLADRRNIEETAAKAVEDILRTVTAEQGIKPDAVVLVAPKDIGRTSSGKVRRSATRAAWLDGTLPVLYEWRAVDWRAIDRAPAS